MDTIKTGNNVYVHERATLEGEVSLGDGASVWGGACIRGDFAPVYIGRQTNVQDNATVHVGKGVPAVIGDGVTIGHNAVVHGCTVEDNVLIGMGAIVMDGAVVGRDSIVGAGALVPPRKRIPAGSLALGSPCRVVRPLTEEEIASVRANAADYAELAARRLAEAKL